MRQKTIRGFVKDNITEYVDVDRADEEKIIADEIIATGVKTADAHHVACALLANCDFFLTTDDRLLKYKTDKILLMDPTEFIRVWETINNDDNK